MRQAGPAEDLFWLEQHLHQFPEGAAESSVRRGVHVVHLAEPTPSSSGRMVPCRDLTDCSTAGVPNICLHGPPRKPVSNTTAFNSFLSCLDESELFILLETKNSAWYKNSNLFDLKILAS